jgi:hypothetical protein
VSKVQLELEKESVEMVSKMNVPYTNFAPKNKQIKQELMNAFEHVLDSGKYIQGPEVKEFELDFAKYSEGGISFCFLLLILIMIMAFFAMK